MLGDPRAVSSPGWPSMLTKATPSGLAIRPRRIRDSLVPPPCEEPRRQPASGVLRFLTDGAPARAQRRIMGGWPAPGRSARARRWSMLGLGLFATLCANVFIHRGFRSPACRARGLDLARAGWRVGHARVPGWCALIAWGYVVDRFGERLVLTVGSALTAALGTALASRWWGCRPCCSLAEWRRRAAIRPAGVWWSVGSSRSGPGDGHPATAQPSGRAGSQILGTGIPPGSGSRSPLSDGGARPLPCCTRSSAGPAASAAGRAPAAQLANPYRPRRWHASICVGAVESFHRACVDLHLVWLIAADNGWSAGSAVLVALHRVLGALGRAGAGRWSDPGWAAAHPGDRRRCGGGDADPSSIHYRRPGLERGRDGRGLGGDRQRTNGLAFTAIAETAARSGAAALRPAPASCSPPGLAVRLGALIAPSGGVRGAHPFPPLAIPLVPVRDADEGVVMPGATACRRAATHARAGAAAGPDASPTLGVDSAAPREWPGGRQHRSVSGGVPAQVTTATPRSSPPPWGRRCPAGIIGCAAAPARTSRDWRRWRRHCRRGGRPIPPDTGGQRVVGGDVAGKRLSVTMIAELARIGDDRAWMAWRQMR